MKNAITILNDHETYTNLDGCTVAVLNDADFERIADGGSLRAVDPGDVTFQKVFDLSRPADLRRLADLGERGS